MIFNEKTKADYPITPLPHYITEQINPLQIRLPHHNTEHINH